MPSSQFLNAYAAVRPITTADDAVPIVIINGSGNVLIQLPVYIGQGISTTVDHTGGCTLTFLGLNGAIVNGTANGTLSRSAGQGTVTKVIGVPGASPKLPAQWTVFNVV